jgi:O-antigen/teichoic acid export membrane protein
MDRSFIKNFVKGFTSTSVGGVIAVGFHFVSIMLMTRQVEKESLGVYFLFVAVVSYLNILGGFGLNLTLVKFVSTEDGRTQKDVLATTIFLRVVALVVTGTIFYLTSRLVLPLFDQRLVQYVGLLVVMFVLTNIEEFFLYLMQGRQQFVGYAGLQILSAFVRVVLLFVFRDRLDFQFLIKIEIAALVKAIVIQLVVTRKLMRGIGLRNILPATIKSTAKFSAPLYMNNILTVIYDRSSTLLIGALLNPVSVAAFEIALKVPDGLMRLFNSFIVVYFPGLSKLFAQGDREGARKFMNNSLVLMSAAILFAALVAFLFGEQIVVLLFSTEYREVALAFALLVVNFFLRAIANIMGYSLVSAGHSAAPIRANIVSIAVNIGSCLVLIPRVGYIGAVYSLILMNITSQVLYLFQLSRFELKPAIGNYFKPVLIFSAILAVYLAIGSENILLKVMFLAMDGLLSWLFIPEIQKFIRGGLALIKKRHAKVEPA